MISKELIRDALSYSDYKTLLTKLLAQGKTTGSHQDEEFLNYAKINLQRMNRLEKTILLSKDILRILPNIKSSYTWLMITEGWCGDAAQTIPVIAEVAKECSSIELKLILRDEHPEIMDLYLTKGSRSIPILICQEKESLKEVFVWGPRPSELQQQVMDLLATGGTKTEKGLLAQTWYNADKAKTLQEELSELLKKLA